MQSSLVEPNKEKKRKAIGPDPLEQKLILQRKRSSYVTSKRLVTILTNLNQEREREHTINMNEYEV